jgi:hypothetical protein
VKSPQTSLLADPEPLADRDVTFDYQHCDSTSTTKLSAVGTATLDLITDDFPLSARSVPRRPTQLMGG